MHVRKLTLLKAACPLVLLFLGSGYCIASRQPHYLEKFDSSQLRVFSISPVRADGSRFAYIIDPSGYLHHVEVGEYLGRHQGLVKEVNRLEVVVSELHRVGREYEEKQTVLRLER